MAEGAFSFDPATLGTSGYERAANDHYPTPAWCTEALLRHVQFRGKIWEPAAGKGDITEVLDFWYAVVSTDIADYGAGFNLQDFLSANELPDGVQSIATNPPYDRQDAFIAQAIRLTEPVRGQVAFLMRHEVDCAARRGVFFQHPAFALKLNLTRRPRWIEGSTGAPRFPYAWFVWDHQHVGAPIVRYAQ